jgi:hypothetical protein
MRDRKDIAKPPKSAQNRVVLVHFHQNLLTKHHPALPRHPSSAEEWTDLLLFSFCNSFSPSMTAHDLSFCKLVPTSRMVSVVSSSELESEPGGAP